jgi:hypothetical protein
MEEPQYDLTETIEAWRSLRDDVREREKIFEESLAEDKVTVKELEGMVLAKLHELKLTSVKIEGKGTAYTSKRTSAKVESPAKFFGFVLETGRTELLEARASKKAVEEYIEAEKVPPPGIRVEVAEGLNFRSKQ